MNVQIKKRSRRAVAEINVVPYIDVMLVLLIIFMVTAPLLTQGVKVDLPKASAKSMDDKQQQPIIVSVDEKGFYYLNIASKPSEPMNAISLQTRVQQELTAAKALQKEVHVYVRGDQHANYGIIMSAMVLLQQAGAEQIGLITEPSPHEKRS
jgi:biopolymer transport protein TolR